MMRLSEVTNVLEKIAPLELAEEWDNVGLLAGDYERPVKKVLLTIDMTAPVVAEAKVNKTDLIVAYHPPIWEPLKNVVAGQGPAPLLYDVILSNMAIYAMHTALDCVAGGVNDALAQVVGIDSPEPLQQPPAGEGAICKLVVFVPEGELEKVSEAIFAAGAGNIGPQGKYSKCSFRCRGTGTFQCGPYSKPAIGRPGSFEQVAEYRLESVVPRAQLPQVIRAMLAAHPYEEAAYDIIPLWESKTTGLGRFGDLKKPIPAPTLIETIKKKLNVNTVSVITPRKTRVKRAAVGAGSCGTLLREVIRNGCDFYLTGELKHHHGLELQAAGVTTVCVGHSNSERLILPQIAKILRRECKGLEVKVSRKDHDPFVYY
ncbi:MAG: Nif3-like dinuclear metal center hexameric protein [Sedimentisphaerales bacterium]|nr:Nif3-like dinuclear metal center hexameric protein [Sedimentisphaerales bacterium]